MRVAVILLALTACRDVPPDRQPLAPSGQPVAQRETREDTRDDRTADTRDELPPSLLEGANEPLDKTDKPKKEPPPMKPASPAPTDPPKASRIAPIKTALCVTTGAAKLGTKVDVPAMRAVAKNTDGEAAALTFTFQGETESQKQLASGDVRRQLGIKLRAQNGCNLIYVMWRLDPKPMIYVQTKINPGAKDHKACGTAGYKKVKPADEHTPPELRVGDKHTLRAEITDDTLEVFVDGERHWRGKLPDTASTLRGPAGIRSDNLAFDLHSFDATTTNVDAGNAKCLNEDND